MKKIIITDRIRQLLDFELFPEEADIEVLTAYSNEDAVDRHCRSNCNLIITELYGSGMNAVQFCSLIREAPDLRQVSIIVYCRANDIELAESRRCRANAVLTLPIERSTLRRAVKEFLSIPPRGEYRVPFSARAASGSFPTALACKTENISITGMLIEANADLKKGDKLNCSLALPASFPVETQTEVVRIVKGKTAGDRDKYGVKFFGLSPAARRSIEMFVDHNPGH